MKTITLLALTFGLILGCRRESVPPPVSLGCAPAVPGLDDDIQATALLHYISRAVALSPYSFSVDTTYYVGTIVQPDSPPRLPGTHWPRLLDAPPAMLSHFPSANPGVRPASEAPTTDDGAIHEFGWDHVIAIGSVCWVGPSRVTIQVGRRDQYPRVSLLTLQLKDGRWVVVSDEEHVGRSAV